MIVEHVNARSLLSSLEEIKLLVNERKIDVLCISETWLEDNIPDRYVNIDGFILFRTDKGRGGGTCIYVRNQLNASLVDMKLEGCEGVESTWVRVQCRKLPSIIIGAVYRHPNSSIDTFSHLQEMFHLVCLKKHPMIALGDLNDDLLSEHSKLRKNIKDGEFGPSYQRAYQNYKYL